jgi:hypothetical protein
MAKKSKKKDAEEQPTTIAPPASNDVKVSAHPKARRSIRTIKGWGGLAGFFLMAFMSWRGGTDLTHTAIRALFAGMACYVVTWTAAVYVWRQIAVAEVRQRARILAIRKIAEEEEAAALAAASEG